MEDQQKIPTPIIDQGSQPPAENTKETKPSKMSLFAPSKKVYKLLIILVIINIVGFAVLKILTKNKKGSNIPVSINSIPPTSNNAQLQATITPRAVNVTVGNWKTFENSDMNITFRYPEIWGTALHNYDNTFVRHEAVAKNFRVISGYIKDPNSIENLSYKQMVDLLEQSAQVKTQNYSLLGMDGVRVKIPYKNNSYEEFIVLAEDNDRQEMTIISYDYDPTLTNNEEVFNKILSTVKRIN